MSEPENTIAGLFSLQGRVAMVTGASSGLGRSIAEALAASDASVALVARDLPRLEAVSAAIEQRFGAATLAASADVTDPLAAEAAVARVIDAFGRLDVLVNAAGGIARRAIVDTSLEEYERVMAANARGTWVMCRAAAAAMAEGGGGAIVNLASTAGVAGMTDRSAYAASKGAVVQLTRALAAELAPQGIRVNSLAPGPFATEMTEQSRHTDRMRGIVERRVPMQRMADASEIQGPAVFLSSSASSFVTGVVLPVDGGWLAS